MVYRGELKTTISHTFIDGSSNAHLILAYNSNGIQTIWTIKYDICRKLERKSCMWECLLHYNLLNIYRLHVNPQWHEEKYLCYPLEYCVMQCLEMG